MVEAVDSRTTPSPTGEPSGAPAGRGAVSHSRRRPPIARPPGRRGTRRVRRALATLLIVAGTLLLADGAMTLLWQEPLSSLHAHRQQDKLERQLADLEHAYAARVERHAPAWMANHRRLASAARAFARRSHDGAPLARPRIPSIGVSAVVVEGTGAHELRAGPGHYAATPLLGGRGTVAIAGHRTTMGAWVRHVDRLGPGDRIELVLPYGRFTYRVQDTRIVPPTALWITKRVGYDRLVLSACHPPFSASERIAVFARLVTGRPAPAAARHPTHGSAAN